MINVISKNIEIDSKNVCNIFLDDGNRIFLPYTTIEVIVCYQKNTLAKKMKTAHLKNFLLAYDVHVYDVSIINLKSVGTNLRKAMLLDDVMALIKYELGKLNKRDSDNQLLENAINTYIDSILTKFK